MAQKMEEQKNIAIREYNRRFHLESKHRAYVVIAVVLLLVSLTLFSLLRIWQNRPQPRFMFLTEAWLADEVDVDALIIRDETVYKSPVDGVFRSLVAQGSKVSKNAHIGQVVPSKDRDEIRKLDKANNDVNDRRYALLAEGKGGNARRVFEASEDSIHRNIHVLYDVLIKDDTLKISEIETELRLIMQQRVEDAQIFDFEDEELARLISVRDRLEESAFQQIRDIRSEASGIFIRQIDGLELELTKERAMSMTIAELKNYLSSVKSAPLTDEVKAGDSLYKLNRSTEHYFVCHIPTQHMGAVAKLQTSARVRIHSIANGISIEDAEVIRNDIGRQGSILVFRSSQNLESFVSMRRAPLTLYFNEARGLRVPKSALINYESGNVEADLKIVEGGYVHQVTVKVLENNVEYALIEAKEGSPYAIKEATMILLNPSSMKEGQAIAKTYN